MPLGAKERNVWLRETDWEEGRVVKDTLVVAVAVTIPRAVSEEAPLEVLTDGFFVVDADKVGIQYPIGMLANAASATIVLKRCRVRTASPL